MPGYGYAAAPKAKVAAWTELIHTYLKGRANLLRVYVLVDARRGLGPTDDPVLASLDEAAVSYQIVLTKADEVKPQALAACAAAAHDGARQAPRRVSRGAHHLGATPAPASPSCAPRSPACSRSSGRRPTSSFRGAHLPSREPGIQAAMRGRGAVWIPGSSLARRPGMTRINDRSLPGDDPMIPTLLVLASLMGAAGVVLAAAAAHAAPGAGLDSAAYLLLFHAVAVLGAAGLAQQGLLWPPAATAAMAGFVLGGTLFAADVSMRAFAGHRLFPMAAPAGGTLLIIAWLVLALAAIVIIVRVR